jgi:hypothetical protein
MPLHVSEHDDFLLSMGLCPLLRGQEYHGSICGSVTDFTVRRRRKGLLFFRIAGGRSWPIASLSATQWFGRFRGRRWGNRPAILWIAEDFGCCASG